MPFSKAYGSLAAFFFALTSIIAFDALTRTLGIWTLCVGLTYALIGLWAGVYFKTRKNTIRNYALFAVMSTLVFDAVTGLGIGPLFFHQSFMVAFIGQIPFTAAHLLGNVGFAILISPALYTLASKEPSTLWRYTFISISNNNI